MPGSTVPAVIDALVALASQALPGWQVTDGQPLQEEADVCAIAYDPEERGVVATQAPGGLSVASQAESYDVNSLLSSWAGDVDVRGARVRAYAALDALAAALAADLTLGGAASRALLVRSSLEQDATASGSVATVRFTVHIEAWR